MMRGVECTYEELTERLSIRLGSGAPNEMNDATVVVIPSISFPMAELRKIVAVPRYEERLLCLIGMLDENPALRMVYVSSLPVAEDIVDYYLSFLTDPNGARQRLRLVSIGLGDERCLGEKLLADESGLERVRAAIHESGRDRTGYIFPFNVTRLERDVAERLCLPVYGAHPDLAVLGTKSGSRKIAREAGVSVMPGTEDVYEPADVRDAVERLRSLRPPPRTAVIKLNNGFSGQGSALIDVEEFVEPIERTPVMFCAAGESWPSYVAKMKAEGAIVEEFVRGEGVVSPSAQVRILTSGEAQLISTHDQVLGGLDSQVYLGCRFPALAEYRLDIADAAARVAEVLASKGVVGAFGVDFVLVPKARGRDVYMSEINLRLGGTTHPFVMASWVTRGTLDSDSGALLTGRGPRCYVASDNIKSPAYAGLGPGDLIRELKAAGVAYDPVTLTGATVHLLGALREHGKLGTVCIGASYAEADEIYEGVVRVLDDLSGRRPGDEREEEKAAGGEGEGVEFEVT